MPHFIARIRALPFDILINYQLADCKGHVARSLSFSVSLFLFKCRGDRVPSDSKRNVFFPTTCLANLSYCAHAYAEYISPVNWITNISTSLSKFQRDNGCFLVTGCLLPGRI